MVATDKLARLTTLLAFLLATLISIAVPAGFYYLGDQNQRAIIATEAEMSSILISQAIGASPDYWRYEERRLAEILARHSANKFAEKRRILDRDNSVIAQSGGEIAPPLLTVGYNLFDAGEVVGRIEIVTSLRPLLLQTIMVGIISTFLGLTFFLSLKFFPLRALSTALRSAAKERERALALLNNISDLAWLKDQDGHYIAVNGPFGRLCGVHPRALPGMTDLDLWPRELAEKYQADDREVMASGKHKETEEEVVDNEGRITWISTIKCPVFDDQGEVIGTSGIGRDISERKQMEDELRESRQYLLDIIQFYPDATMIIDNAGKVIAWNRAMEELSGVPAEAMLGKSNYEYALPFYSERRPILIDLALQPDADIERTYAHIKRNGETLIAESYIHNARGEELYFHGTATALHNSQGKIIGAIESLRDMSSRKHFEEMIQEKEKKLRTITDIAQDAIVMIDDDGRITFWNPAAGKIFGYAADEVLGTELHSFLAAPRYREGHEAAFPRFRATGQGLAVGKTLELAAIRKGGEEFPIELSLSAMQIKEHWHAVGIMRDITERKREEDELKRARDFYLTLFEKFPALIWRAGIDKKCNYFNATWLAFTGRPLELEMGDGWAEGVHPDDLSRCFSTYVEAFDRHEPFRMEYRLRHHSGEYRWITDFGEPFNDTKGVFSGYIGTCFDITESKNSSEIIRLLNDELELKVVQRTNELLTVQEELIRHEKLAILGRLSGSISHELRNPLGVMNNAVYFLKMVNADATTREYLDIIKHEIDNSQRIISDLLDFARTRTPQVQGVTARQIVDESLGKCVIPENVDLQIDLPEALPPLMLDPLQMGQVFQNLITNAIQAMTEGGSLQITARHLGDFVAISVTDSGGGITPEDMKKLFQPLFTTKAKGIGLGLVVCKNLVEANGGRIETETVLGVGTTFTVFLPVGESA